MKNHRHGKKETKKIVRQKKLYPQRWRVSSRVLKKKNTYFYMIELLDYVLLFFRTLNH